MKRLFPIILLICVLFSQSENSLYVLGAEYAKTISVDRMQAHLTFLSSDALQGRGNTTNALDVTAEYLRAQLKLMGLQPGVGDSSYFQQYFIQKITPLDAELSIQISGRGFAKKTLLNSPDDFFTSYEWMKCSKSGAVEIAFVGYGLSEDRYDDYSDVLIDGKFVMFLDGVPETEDTNSVFAGLSSRLQPKVEKAKELGAQGALVVQMPNDERTMREKYEDLKQHIESPSIEISANNDSDNFPIFNISTEVADKILKTSWGSVKKITKKIKKINKSQSFFLEDVSLNFSISVNSEQILTNNVLAFVPGLELPEEFLVYSAHYDHKGVINGKIYNGADDNGTGLSALLEIARSYVVVPAHPKRSVMFFFTSGEEEGLLGSRYFSDNPTINLENVVVNLNLDMIGRNTPDSVYVIGSDRLSQELHNINENTFEFVPEIFPNYKYNAHNDPNNFYNRSDHYNFAKHGIPVIFYFAGLHEDYHKPTDTMDKINLIKLEKIAKIAFITGWNVANRSERLNLLPQNGKE